MKKMKAVFHNEKQPFLFNILPYLLWTPNIEKPE